VWGVPPTWSNPSQFRLRFLPSRTKPPPESLPLVSYHVPRAPHPIPPVVGAPLPFLKSFPPWVASHPLPYVVSHRPLPSLRPLADLPGKKIARPGKRGNRKTPNYPERRGPRREYFSHPVAPRHKDKSGSPSRLELRGAFFPTPSCKDKNRYWILTSVKYG